MEKIPIKINFVASVKSFMNDEWKDALSETL